MRNINTPDDVVDPAIDLARYIVKEHEKFISHAYKDSLGYLTIGFGRMIDLRLGGGIDEEEGEFLLERDIARSNVELRTAFRWFHKLDDQRRAALIDMHVNLGLPKLMGFSKMIAALAAGEFEKAACEALDSKWARQVGRRANEIADMIRGNARPD